MKKLVILSIALLSVLLAGAQSNVYENSAGKLLNTEGKLTIGGYGEVHYNQPIKGGEKNLGQLDVHRMILMVGYNFNSKTQLITELEFEHVKEVYVEQAFLQHKLNKYINLRAGLLLTPMGIINEYHEPTTFNGVERPMLDKRIAPTTWREIGFGFAGTYLPASLRYQAYVVNGFVGFDGGTKFDGKNALRKGRQKGAESFMSSPNYTAKVEYFGIRGLNVGVSGYFGKSQSSLFDGLNTNNDELVAQADSSVVGISMFGTDARYTTGALSLKGQFYYTKLSNTEEYNALGSADLGNAMMGYYAEAAYNVFKHIDSDMRLEPFVRYSNYDTHFGVASNLTRNKAYNKTYITSGVSLHLTQGAVLKADIQMGKDADKNEFSSTFNAGFGVMF